MNKIRFTLKAFAFLAFTFAFATAAQAQATRTWVSGVGDDVNPCSRTAPCKTFAGAISKTAAGGEIDALDPGGFGAVTLTKSITIDGTQGSGFGSILASGTNGVNVNDSATALPNSIVVTLRNLSINGAGTTLGVNGINFTSGKAVNVEHCTIFNFSNAGINVAKTTGVGAELYVSDTSIFATTTGIKLSSTAGGSFISANVRNCDIKRQTNGIRLDANAFAEITGSSLQFCTGAGISMAGAGAQFSMIDSLIAHSGTGIAASGAGSTGRLAHSSILLNGTGVSFAGGATVRTFGDNNFDGNPTPFSGGTLTAIAPAKQ
jgi:hypothetical protein